MHASGYDRHFLAWLARKPMFSGPIDLDVDDRHFSGTAWTNISRQLLPSQTVDDNKSLPPYAACIFSYIVDLTYRA